VTIPGSLSELGADAIHPNDVMHFSERQYRERHSRNLAGIDRQFIPEPFNPDSRVDWTPLWSLTERRHKLLPTDLLLFPRRDRPSDRPRDCTICSNGCATRNMLEEAVLQGFLELIERDAVAMWWYNRLRRPTVDLASFDDPWLSNVGPAYDRWGRDLVAIDLTNDPGAEEPPARQMWEFHDRLFHRRTRDSVPQPAGERLDIAEEPLGQIKKMRPQITDDTGAGDPLIEAPAVIAFAGEAGVVAHIEMIGIAQVTAINQLFEIAGGRHEAVGEWRQRLKTARLRRLRHFARLRVCEGDRFLAEHMQARVERFHGDGIVRAVGRGDDDSVKIGAFNHLAIVGKDLRDSPGIGHAPRIAAISTADGDGVGGGMTGQRGQVHGVRPPARADDADGYCIASHSELP